MKALDILSEAQKISSLKKGDFALSIKIKLITNFTDQILQKMLAGLCLANGIYPELEAAPYRQYDILLSDRSGPLYSTQSDIAFIFFDANPLNHSPFNDKDGGHFERVFEGLQSFCASTKEPVVICTFPTPFRGPYGNLFEQERFFRMIKEFNSKLRSLSGQFSNVHVLDIDRLIQRFGEDNVRDLRGMYAFDLPFTNDFFLEIAKEMMTFVLHLRGKMKKCLVLDLDNTLWGGVVGEAGPHGVALGPQYPGVAFQNFQRAILACFEKGMLLAINSKNNEADVDEIFEKNPHMILKKHHFAASRVNWGNKADNIISIAEELNIGLDSMVFIDDDPLNREIVRGTLPGVLVPEFSIPPEKYAHMLFSLPIFSQFRITDEDKEKGRMYAEEKIRKDILARTTSAKDYISALGLSMKVRCNERSWVPRLSQLTLKTNQFNVTTKRYGEKEIGEFMDKGLVYAAEVDDKFGSYGITILSIVETKGEVATIDTFLMSCRVMGRGVEEIFLDHIIKDLQKNGVVSVEAEFIPTAKNAPAHDFFTKAGFVESGRDKSGKIAYTLSIRESHKKPHDLAELITLIAE